ncbi:hypothetical protein DPMN_178926 [Dreissena polymorpha]|uniref:CUB domain-containing protein n=1 Tax=Dreissena polymorpha TaxID=45954 RepID=A0A9D4EE88_DREPO|nr:hypothetical protein DPMN_178926 [Dreissena polymorpha]
MDDYCGSRITLYNDHQIALQFSDDEECEVTIETTRQFPMMMLYIKSFSVSCLNGNVSIRNQYGRPPDGLSGALCGSVSSSKMYKSDGEVKIKYNPIKGIRWTYGSFTLIITLYTDSEEEPPEHPHSYADLQRLRCMLFTQQLPLLAILTKGFRTRITAYICSIQQRISRKRRCCMDSHHPRIILHGHRKK